KDKRTGNPLPLKDWTLKDYIDVAHELRWITQSARDVGGVLRDYRNYIHPQKELSHGITLVPDDAVVLWEVAKSISKQLLKIRLGFRFGTDEAAGRRKNQSVREI